MLLGSGAALGKCGKGRKTMRVVSAGEWQRGPNDIKTLGTKVKVTVLPRVTRV